MVYVVAEKIGTDCSFLDSVCCWVVTCWLLILLAVRFYHLELIWCMLLYTVAEFKFQKKYFFKIHKLLVVCCSSENFCTGMIAGPLHFRVISVDTFTDAPFTC